MDPFSLTVGAVGLLDTANKLTKSLLDRYEAFSSAPRKMSEIANDVTMVAGLVEVFSQSVDGAGTSIKFPERFQRDAKNLVEQCFDILRDIDALIPSGSTKPDYSVRLHYAFGNEKKIQKYQEKLKQVQHMFMFMTTMWMYQLPSLQQKQPQPVESRPDNSQRPKGDLGLSDLDMGGGAPTLSTGSWTGVMQQVPVTIGGMGGGVSYEATLTLNPIPLSQTHGRRERLKAELPVYARERTIKRVGRNEKTTLENLRRSPYFSMNLFGRPQNMAAFSSRGDDVEYEYKVGGTRITRSHTKERIVIAEPGEEKKRKEDDEDRYKYDIERARREMDLEQEKRKEKDEDSVFASNVLSSEDAKAGVEEMLAQWFYDDRSPPGHEEYHISETSTGYQTPSSSRLSPGPSSSGARVVVIEREPPGISRSSSSARRRRPSLSPSSLPNRRPSQSPSSLSSQKAKPADWDWRCDNCDRKFELKDKSMASAPSIAVPGTRREGETKEHCGFTYIVD
ncbi:hypothetical protein G7Y89_g9166 [Cudoniella acicularis]|uniref:Fungal N-terminal domain-containing protein n=1 Tax=Cudoniella acicularis TaxID=354080 RepID=A0A8H4RF65_9HELO|nr:hypothetical protein G7Y89_g9166 [Cudoniella acicularis]